MTVYHDAYLYCLADLIAIFPCCYIFMDSCCLARRWWWLFYDLGLLSWVCVHWCI